MPGKWLPAQEYAGKGTDDAGILWRKYKDEGESEEFTEEEVRPYPKDYFK